MKLVILIQFFLHLLLGPTQSFSPVVRPHDNHCQHHRQPRLTITTTTRMQEADSAETDVSSMRVREIQSALKEIGVSYTDCFDRESLVQRLQEARHPQGNPHSTATTTTTESTKASPTTSTKSSSPAESSSDSESSSSPAFDRSATLQELRSMRVAALRTECSSRNIRWGTMLEKEELVQALLEAREAAASGFSLSGALAPGRVGTLRGPELERELNSGPSSTATATKATTTTIPPLLLDVYATWCGPCQLMAPQLVEAAAELGDRVRVAKMDSDQFPEWSSKLKVKAFPTVLVFDGNGNEVKRVEGALTKNQLVNLVEPFL